MNNNYTVLYPGVLNFDLEENAKLSTHYSANPEGDWVGLSAVLRMMLDEIPKEKSIQLLEVGTAHGHFLRSFYEYVDKQRPGKVLGFGVDSKLHGYCPCMFIDKMKFVEGVSTNPATFNQFRNQQFDFVFIDGCHCSKHAELDARNYCNKVKVGGYLGFHDSSPTFQGGSEQPRTPDCAEDTHIGVVKGIEASGIKENGFEFFLEEYHVDSKYYGGVTVFKEDQMIEPLWKSLDGIEQLCKVGLEDIQSSFQIKEDLWKEYVEKEIKLNKDLMRLIWKRQDGFDWTKETPLGGAGTSLNALVLYCLIRHYKMNYVIETGVSGGFYTAFMMDALHTTNDYPILTSLELSEDMTEVGKLIPQSIKDYTIGNENHDELDWNLKTGKSSLEWFENNKGHNASLYSHDSLHTMTHMMKELNEFKKSSSRQFIIFIDDEKSDNFWNRCLEIGAFRKPRFNVKYISGKESRLQGHLGGFIKFTQKEIIE